MTALAAVEKKNENVKSFVLNRQQIQLVFKDWLDRYRKPEKENINLSQLQNSISAMRRYFDQLGIHLKVVQLIDQNFGQQLSILQDIFNQLENISSEKVENENQWLSRGQGRLMQYLWLDPHSKFLERDNINNSGGDEIMGEIFGLQGERALQEMRRYDDIKGVAEDLSKDVESLDRSFSSKVQDRTYSRAQLVGLFKQIKEQEKYGRSIDYSIFEDNDKIKDFASKFIGIYPPASKMEFEQLRLLGNILKRSHALLLANQNLAILASPATRQTNHLDGLTKAFEEYSEILNNYKDINAKKSADALLKITKEKYGSSGLNEVYNHLLQKAAELDSPWYSYYGKSLWGSMKSMAWDMTKSLGGRFIYRGLEGFAYFGFQTSDALGLTRGKLDSFIKYQGGWKNDDYTKLDWYQKHVSTELSTLTEDRLINHYGLTMAEDALDAVAIVFAVKGVLAARSAAAALERGGVEVAESVGADAAAESVANRSGFLSRIGKILRPSSKLNEPALASDLVVNQVREGAESKTLREYYSSLRSAEEGGAAVRGVPVNPNHLLNPEGFGASLGKTRQLPRLLLSEMKEGAVNFFTNPKSVRFLRGTGRLLVSATVLGGGSLVGRTVMPDGFGKNGKEVAHNVSNSMIQTFLFLAAFHAVNLPMPSTFQKVFGAEMLTYIGRQATGAFVDSAYYAFLPQEYKKYPIDPKTGYPDLDDLMIPPEKKKKIRQEFLQARQSYASAISNLFLVFLVFGEPNAHRLDKLQFLYPEPPKTVDWADFRARVESIVNMSPSVDTVELIRERVLAKPEALGGRSNLARTFEEFTHTKLTEKQAVALDKKFDEEFETAVRHGTEEKARLEAFQQGFTDGTQEIPSVLDVLPQLAQQAEGVGGQPNTDKVEDSTGLALWNEKINWKAQPEKLIQALDQLDLNFEQIRQPHNQTLLDEISRRVERMKSQGIKESDEDDLTRIWDRDFGGLFGSARDVEDFRSLLFGMRSDQDLKDMETLKERLETDLDLERLSPELRQRLLSDKNAAQYVESELYKLKKPVSLADRVPVGHSETSGLSLYPDGLSRPIAYRLYDANGKELGMDIMDSGPTNHSQINMKNLGLGFVFDRAGSSAVAQAEARADGSVILIRQDGAQLEISGGVERQYILRFTEKPGQNSPALEFRVDDLGQLTQTPLKDSKSIQQLLHSFHVTIYDISQKPVDAQTESVHKSKGPLKEHRYLRLVKGSDGKTWTQTVTYRLWKANGPVVTPDGQVQPAFSVIERIIQDPRGRSRDEIIYRIDQRSSSANAEDGNVDPKLNDFTTEEYRLNIPFENVDLANGHRVRLPNGGRPYWLDPETGEFHQLGKLGFEEIWDPTARHLEKAEEGEEPKSYQGVVFIKSSSGKVIAYEPMEVAANMGTQARTHGMSFGDLYFPHNAFEYLSVGPDLARLGISIRSKEFTTLSDEQKVEMIKAQYNETLQKLEGSEETDKAEQAEKLEETYGRLIGYYGNEADVREVIKSAESKYLETLEIDPNSKDWTELTNAEKLEKIKKTYRKLAMEYHPDKNPDDEGAAKRFEDLAKAYEFLNDLIKSEDSLGE